MFENILKNIYKEFWYSHINYISRDFAHTISKNKLSYIIIGPRRSGKSYFLYNIIDILGKKKEDIIFVNFEDPRLTGFTANNLLEILETYKQIFPDKKPILFLDEIQNIEGFAKYVWFLVDTGHRVFITGSDSITLNLNVIQKLGGRLMHLDFYPLNFKEFMYFKDNKINPNTLPKFKLLSFFDEYLEFGGFPEVVLNNDKKNILTTYYNLVISDILKQNSSFKEFEIKNIVKKIRENIGKPTTISSFLKFFTFIDYKINKNKLYDYFDKLESHFFILSLENYTKSVKKRTYEKKYYLIDNGYIKIMDIEGDLGLKLENLVFLELLKKKDNVFYWQNEKKQECDFVIEEKGKIVKAIQVAYELNDQNKDREIKGLLEAMKFFKLKEGLLLIYDGSESKLEIEGKKIIVKPVLKWLLE